MRAETALDRAHPFPLQVQSIFAHFPAADFSLFLGDMNYRVDLPSDRVRSLASSAAYSDILAHCQLNKVVQQHGSPFAGFCEAPIHFAPSYSYDPGTDNFDSSAKARIPSYCDRILWRAQIRSGSTWPISCCCSCYTMSSLNASDHKPVVAVLQLCMTHPKPDARASCSVTPVTPMNIGAHGRMHSATQGALPFLHPNSRPMPHASPIRLRHRQAPPHAGARLPALV